MFAYYDIPHINGEIFDTCIDEIYAARDSCNKFIEYTLLGIIHDIGRTRGFYGIDINSIQAQVKLVKNQFQNTEYKELNNLYFNDELVALYTEPKFKMQGTTAVWEFKITDLTLME